MTDVTIRKTIYLRAAPAQVWAYLTEPEKLAVWFHRPDKALTEGDYAVYAPDGGEKMMWGRVIVAQPFERLHYTFAIPAFGDSERRVPADTSSRVHFTVLSLSPNAGIAKV